MWFIGVEVEQQTSAPPPKKILDPPLRREAEVMMTVKTKELPKIATNASGTSMTQSTMTVDQFELEVTKQLLKLFITYSKYFPDSDWLKAHV